MVAWLGWMWLACAGSPAPVATSLETPAVQWVEHRYGEGPEHRVDWITREGAGPRPVVLFPPGRVQVPARVWRAFRLSTIGGRGGRLIYSVTEYR